MLAIPPQLYMGGQYIVLLYTVAKLTHFIMPANVDFKIQILKNFLLNGIILPKATRGPQWRSLEQRDKHMSDGVSGDTIPS